MSREFFDNLEKMLQMVLVINETRSYARSQAGPRIPEIRLYCLMRYLAGEPEIVGAFVALTTFSWSTRPLCHQFAHPRQK
jgi:hypothetical protein